MTVELSVRDRLDNALRDYVADQTDGSVLVDWVTIAASTTIEDIGTGRNYYLIVAPPQQSAHATLGLLKHGGDQGIILIGPDDE